MEKLCEKCGKKVYAKGLCRSCYNAQWKKGNRPKGLTANFLINGENAEEIRYITKELNIASTQTTTRLLLDIALNDVPQQFIYDALRRRKNNA